MRSGIFPFIYRRLDNAAVPLTEHQSGLRSLVQDFTPAEFKNNVFALARLATYFKLPTILTTSFEDGPNGPILPALKENFPDATFVVRPGNINAWENEDFLRRSRLPVASSSFLCCERGFAHNRRSKIISNGR
jgi:hypothetical protein